MSERRTTLGASEVATILGFSPWSSPFALWARIHGLTEADTSTSTTRGQILEPAIRDWYARSIGAQIIAGPEYGATPWTRQDRPWQAARPDGYWWAGGEPPMRLLEIKTTRDWSDWTDGVPAYYAVQVLWQQWVAAGSLWGAPTETHLVAFATMSDEIRTFVLPYDEQAQQRAERLSELVSAWWERHIEGGEPVEADAHAATREAIRQMYARPTREFLPPTPERTALVEDYRRAVAARKALEPACELARNRLLVEIGNTAGIDGLCTLSAGKARRLTLKGEPTDG